MGDRQKRALRVQFDGRLRLESQGAKITSGAGLLPFRELDEAFRLTEKASVMLSDPRRGKNTQHSMLVLLRQAIYGRFALPRSVKHWSLTTLREKLIKIGAKVVTHSRYVIFQMAEVAVPRDTFAAILERIQRFGVPPLLGAGTR